MARRRLPFKFCTNPASLIMIAAFLALPCLAPFLDDEPWSGIVSAKALESSSEL
jgi:hypothetical protein